MIQEEKWIYFSSLLSSKLINRFKNPKSFEYKSILVVKLDEIGDAITASHCFELIHKSYPNAQITLWCKPFIKSLFVKNPFIHQLVDDHKDLKGSFDLVIDLRGNWKSIFYSILHPPKIRLDRGLIRFKNKFGGGHPHEVYTNIQIIEPILKHEPQRPQPRVYYNEEEIDQVEKLLSKHSINNVALFHCGARKKLRQWPSQSFALIAKYLKDKYNYDIIFIGDNFDKLQNQEIQALIPFTTFNFAGEINLRALAYLCHRSKFFIGNESGPLHIAASENIPCIGLYGPGVPHTFYPFGLSARYLHAILKCNPCNQIDCVQPENPCIQLIPVWEVKKMIDELHQPKATS